MHFILFYFISQTVVGQGVTDAVRYAFLSRNATARVGGVNGAFGAMGGDLSSTMYNPAGIADFRRGEFTISLSVLNANTSSKFATLNTAEKEGKTRLALDNIGFVNAKNRENSKWKTSNFAFTLNKIADLHNKFAVAGKTLGSITERFKEVANTKVPDDLDAFEGQLAYTTGAIFDLNDDQYYESDFSDNEFVDKAQLVEQKGYVNELSLAYGANYDEKVNIGIAIGVPFVNFEEIKSYYETDNANANPTFNSLQYDEYLNTTGVGINIKAGVIVKPLPWLRIGGAIHSPTAYSFADDYYTSMSYSYVNNDGETESFDGQSPDGSFNYKYKSPLRMMASIGGVFNISEDLKAFVNGDYESIDYGASSFDFSGESASEVNSDINTYLGKSKIVRLGGELAYRSFRLRIGGGREQSPYSADTKWIQSRSIGLGLRYDGFYVDLAMQNRLFDEGYLPYVVLDNDRNPLTIKNISKTNWSLTTGFKF